MSPLSMGDVYLGSEIIVPVHCVLSTGLLGVIRVYTLKDLLNPNKSLTWSLQARQGEMQKQADKHTSSLEAKGLLGHLEVITRGLSLATRMNLGGRAHSPPSLPPQGKGTVFSTPETLEFPCWRQPG